MGTFRYWDTIYNATLRASNWRRNKAVKDIIYIKITQQSWRCSLLTSNTTLGGRCSNKKPIVTTTVNKTKEINSTDFKSFRSKLGIQNSVIAFFFRMRGLNSEKIVQQQLKVILTTCRKKAVPWLQQDISQQFMILILNNSLSLWFKFCLWHNKIFHTCYFISVDWISKNCWQVLLIM